jgi:di/tricarboxylate transporter
MLKGTLVALTAVLALALPARAASREAGTASLLPPSPVTSTEFAQQVTTVESRPTTAGIIARDAIGGAVAGTAVAGGVILWRRYVESNGTWGDWGRDLALGAGIGLAVGLVFGAVDAASNADRRFTGAVVDERQSGFAPAFATYGRRY